MKGLTRERNHMNVSCVPKLSFVSVLLENIKELVQGKNLISVRNVGKRLVFSQAFESTASLTLDMDLIM